MIGLLRMRRLVWVIWRPFASDKGCAPLGVFSGLSNRFGGKGNRVCLGVDDRNRTSSGVPHVDCKQVCTTLTIV